MGLHPGQCNNPHGRPTGDNDTYPNLCRRIGNEKVQFVKDANGKTQVVAVEPKSKMSRKEWTVRSLFSEAANGNIKAVEVIARFIKELPEFEDSKGGEYNPADQEASIEIVDRDPLPESTPI
jgi:hypothetical protein